MIIPVDLLKDKNILLGVSGSIAVYKSLELTRLLLKAGANVKVVMSKASKKFVTALSFETLTSNKVLDDLNESWVNNHNHIQTSQWADVFIIAPATANTIAKLSNAVADNILLQCALAYPKTILLAPSANTNMLHSPITQKNLKILTNTNYKLIQTQTKELACKTVGDGAMAEVIDIFWATSRELLKNKFWTNRDIILTGGATIEKIDDVRYISNFSSGKMASSLATALYCMGANVTLIATKFEDNLAKSIRTIDVENSQEMMKNLIHFISISKQEKKPYLFMLAAVSDYVPKLVQKGKLKKEQLGDTFELSLKKNIDILDSLDKKNIISIGFKAEMDAINAKTNAQKMLKNKKLDAVCLNILKDSSSFGSQMNQIEFISKTKEVLFPQTTKLALSFKILAQSESLS